MTISTDDRAILDSPRHAVMMELDDICTEMEFADAADLERLDAAHVAVIAKLRAIDEAPTAPPAPICPECRSGELHPTTHAPQSADPFGHRARTDAGWVACDNCGRVWDLPPTPAESARPGTALARAGR